MKKLLQLFRRGLPLGKLLKDATDIDETIGEEIVQKTDIGMARVIENLQQLRGRKVKLSIEISIDEFLEAIDIGPEP